MDFQNSSLLCAFFCLDLHDYIILEPDLDVFSWPYSLSPYFNWDVIMTG